MVEETRETRGRLLMNIEEQLNREIERAHESGNLNLECTLMLARHTIYMRERALDLRDQEIRDLNEQIRGARGLLELRRERIEDLLKELEETENN